MRALRYAFTEAAASLWRGRQSSVMSTATIALALFVLGAFLIVASNLERLGREWRRTAELSVYLDDEISPAAKNEIERLLAPSDLVTGVEYVSKDEALRRFKTMFSDLAPEAESLEGNPLPSSFEVELGPAARDAAALQRFADSIRQAEGVTDVRYDQQWLDRLESATRLVRVVGLALSGLLTLAGALAVANVIRLTLHARRDELEIMQLVGAPPAYVRGPFVAEGLLQGGMGAASAVALLAIVYLALRARYLDPLAAAINLSSVRFLGVGTSLLLIVGGMGVGSLGGWLASRRL